jgi:hypothetical protein
MDGPFIETKQIVNSPTSKENWALGDNASQVLARAMLSGYKGGQELESGKMIAVDYKTKDGQRLINFNPPSNSELSQLVENFREEPKKGLAMARVNLIEIARDKKLPENEREQRLERYLQAYIDLMIEIDHRAFPADGPTVVHEGIPAYIPDGLSDMGGDPRTDPSERGREKIRVDKRKVYQGSFGRLKQAIWSLKDTALDPSSAEIKKYLINFVMISTYLDMPYDHTNRGINPLAKMRSIGIDEYSGAGEPVSVCRHQAMETVLRGQALGLEFRLAKCRLDRQKHVAVMFRVDKQWYLGDPTNPEADPRNPKNTRAFIRKVEPSGEARQRWTFDRWVPLDDVSVKTKIDYELNPEMYYRVLKN